MTWTVETWPPTGANMPGNGLVAETFAVVYRQGTDVAVLCHEKCLPEFVGSRFTLRYVAESVAAQLNREMQK